jgi:glycosyltransferase involved in cell wall biosynthesis
MHVAFVATPDLSYISGSSLSLRYTAEALGRRGVRCTIFCQRAPAAPAAPLVSYVELPIPLDYQVTTDSVPTTADLAACLTQLTTAVVAVPDLDLVHAIYGTFTGVAASAAGALREVPVVITTFGRDVTLGASVDGRYRRLMCLAYADAALVVASDDAVAALVRARYAGPMTGVTVLPPGMNFPMLRGMAATARSRTPAHRILAVQSSFNQNKGLPILIDALTGLVPYLPDAVLVVAGHDDTPGARIEAALRAQARRNGVADRIQWKGHLSHRAVARLMGRCDVLADPRTINSFSSCLYEAMTVGLPVVASDVACNRAALGNGVRGVLTRAGDADDLAVGIRSVLTDRALAEDLRSSGTAYTHAVEATAGCEAVAERLHQLYEELVRASAGERTSSTVAARV